MTLSELTPFATVDDALEYVAQRTPERFQTRIGVVDGVGPVTMWHGDAGYESGDPSAAGARHRLTMNKGGPWRYERTDRPSQAG